MGRPGARLSLWALLAAQPAFASGEQIRILAHAEATEVSLVALDDRFALSMHNLNTTDSATLRFTAVVRCPGVTEHVELTATLAPGERRSHPWPACPADAAVQVLELAALHPSAPTPPPRSPTEAEPPGRWGLRLAAGPSTLFKTADLAYPDLGWRVAPTAGASFDWPLATLLDLRGLGELSIRGASLDAGAAGTGHVELWTLKLGATLRLHLGDPGAALRPFVQFGPYAAWSALARAELEGSTLDADPSAPYRALDWGLVTGVGLGFDAWGQRWAVDLRLDTGLSSLADPEYPAFARTPDDGLRATDAQLGATWSFP